MKRLYLKIFGQIQGVGLRFWLQTEADKLGLTGWAKNLPDGTVAVVLEGPTTRLEGLVDQCYNRNKVIHIDKLYVTS